jgi:hypothetical protein
MGSWSRFQVLDWICERRPRTVAAHAFRWSPACSFFMSSLGSWALRLSPENWAALLVSPLFSGLTAMTSHTASHTPHPVVSGRLQGHSCDRLRRFRDLPFGWRLKTYALALEMAAARALRASV